MLCSSFAGLQITSHAAELPSSGKCGENITYTFDASTGLLTISDSGEMDGYYWEWEINDDGTSRCYKYFSQSYIAKKIMILTINNYKKTMVRIGDLLYFNEGDNKGIHHAALITKVDKNSIYYTAHTNPVYDKIISKYFKNKKQKLYLVVLGGS
ncbi:MAG: amidase domain-containing protein [Clostridia bacterium]|nr:amidase domain-containing protein [Clostridia bacterium]